MSAKTPLLKNGKPLITETDTMVEDPSIGMPASFSLPDPVGMGQTEVEDVEGFNFVKAGDADKEVVNPTSRESDLVEVTYGIEQGSVGAEFVATEGFALDAFFASYPQLKPEPSKILEVIIGADNRVRINPTTTYPWRAICALKITAQNGTKWIGTGWLVSPRTVITAGHCVYMHDEGGWAKSIEVIPALNDASRPYNSGVSTTFKSVTGWTQSKNRENDYGAIILPANYRPGDQTGYFGYAVKDDNFIKSSVLNISGYPGDKGGNQQWFMALQTKSVSSRVITYDIDTMGGQSGAPVWVKIGDSRYCVGIHTNGHSSGNSATRIVQAVFDNIKNWKALGM